jgi:hypothetical protein
MRHIGQIRLRLRSLYLQDRFMKNLLKLVPSVAMIAAMVFTSTISSTAQRRNDRDVKDAVGILSSKLDSFDSSLTYQLRSTSASRDIADEAADDITDVRSALRDFQSSYEQKRETRDDVDHLVSAAGQLDNFLQTNPQNRSIQNDWNTIRSQIERIASNYGVTVSWTSIDRAPGVRDQQYPVQKGSVVVGLTGTYSLDVSKSESLDDALGGIKVTSDQRQDLKDKLVSPAQIAIDVRGSRVTLATSNASPVTITADGSEKSEPDGTGASIRLKASLSGSDLTISSLGGETDYTVTFTSLDGGRSLKVSRRITTDYLDQTVFAESVYNKVDNNAGLGISVNNNDGSDVAGTNDSRDTGNSTRRTSDNQNGGYSDNDQGTGVDNGGSPTYGGNGGNGRNGRSGSGRRQSGNITSRNGDFVVPNGEVITGTLESEINTSVSQDNDRFRMTVTSPDRFRGAVVEGYISGVSRSGRATGRSNVTLNFEKITFNGKTYDFAGNLQSIVDQNGKPVKIDSEGTAQGGNQTVQTAKRGGIGAGIGAVIGAIAGGGSGAAIGAAIGAGAGAGTVIAQGRIDIRLTRGSTIVVQSSSPIRQGAEPNVN